jgi:hypothetical protein
MRTFIEVALILAAIFTGIGILVALLLYLVVFPMQDKQAAFCATYGWERITIDRSWACIDPKTRQLYR